MSNAKANRRLALLGILGGPVMFIAEMLSVLVSGFSLSNKGLRAWGALSGWRITLSVSLGVVGTLLVLCGLWAGYRLVRAHCHQMKRSLYLFGMAGRGVGALFHFLVFCLLPLSMKVIAATGTVGDTAIERMKSSLAVIRVPMILCAALMLLGAVLVTAGLLSEDVHVSRNLAVLNAATLGILGAVLFMLVEDWSWRGVFLGLFNLGDSLQALAIWRYWNKKHKEADRQD